MFLTRKQVEQLTRRKQAPAQARVLAAAGIPFRMVDGRPIVTADALSPVQGQQRGPVLDARYL